MLSSVDLFEPGCRSLFLFAAANLEVGVGLVQLLIVVVELHPFLQETAT